MHALVTGATGFIGSHLVNRLSREGWDVICLIRESSDISWIEDSGCVVIKCDLNDRRSLARAVRGQDVVFHLAGITSATSPDEYYYVNASATECIVETVAHDCGSLQRFVYLSSLAASGPADTGRGSGGEMPVPVSDYGRSKLKGEEAVMNCMDRIPCTILRPAAVYGPRDREFLRIFRWVNRGIVPTWGESLLSLLYVDDLIEAMMRAVERESAVGRRLFVSDGNTYSTGAVLSEIGSALERDFVKLRLPEKLLPVIGFLGDGICKIRGTKSMINSDKMRELRHHSWTCDISSAKEALGFEPATSLKEGIKWTAEWYRIHGWL